MPRGHQFRSQIGGQFIAAVIDRARQIAQADPRAPPTASTTWPSRISSAPASTAGSPPPPPAPALSAQAPPAASPRRRSRPRARPRFRRRKASSGVSPVVTLTRASEHAKHPRRDSGRGSCSCPAPAPSRRTAHMDRTPRPPAGSYVPSWLAIGAPPMP